MTIDYSCKSDVVLMYLIIMLLLNIHTNLMKQLLHIIIMIMIMPAHLTHWTVREEIVTYCPVLCSGRVCLLLCSFLVLACYAWYYLSQGSTSFIPGFCVCRQSQYKIYWEFIFLPGFFVSSWSVAWVDEVNGCGSVLQEAGDLMEGLISAPQCKWNISSFLTLPRPQIASLCQGYHDNCVITANDGGMGRLGGCFMYVSSKRRGGGYHTFLYSVLVFVNCSFITGA